jgi:hypothetical protein
MMPPLFDRTIARAFGSLRRTGLSVVEAHGDLRAPSPTLG